MQYRRGIIAAADEQPFDLQSCRRSEAGNIRRIKAAQFFFANLFLRIARHGEINHGARYSFSYRGVTFQKPDFNAALDEQFFLNQTVQHKGTVFGGWCLGFVSEKGLQGGGIFGAVIWASLTLAIAPACESALRSVCALAISATSRPASAPAINTRRDSFSSPESSINFPKARLCHKN